MKNRPAPTLVAGSVQLETIRYQTGPMAMKFIPERRQKKFVNLKKCPNIIQIRQHIVELVKRNPKIRLMFSMELGKKVLFSILHIFESFSIPAKVQSFLSPKFI